MNYLKKIFTSVILVAILLSCVSFNAQSDVIAEDPTLFKGGKLFSEMNDAQDGMIYAYSDTTEADFDAYMLQLENAGYTLKYNYELDFAMFAAYEKDGDLIYFYHTANNGEMRIIKDAYGVLPPTKEEYTVKQSEDTSYFTPVIMKSKVETELIAQSKITQINVLYSEDNHGMAYAITLSDGSFILIDGGNDWEPQSDHLWNVLNALNERKDGKIVIRAWIVTHLHADHTRALINFAQKYGSQCELGYLIANGVNSLDGFPSNLPEYVQYFGGSPKFLLPHTGQVMQFENATVEFFYTPEDIIEETIEDFNDTSMIFRVSLGGQSAMFVGDAQVLAGNTAIENFKGHLNADFVQISHHGYGDIGYEFYREVGATFGFWPHEIEYYEQYSRELSTEVDRTQFWSEKNMIYSFINHLEVADPYTSTVTLPFDFKIGAVQHHDIPRP